MANKPLVAGDLVKLKSGGPKMVVINYEKIDDVPTGMVLCKWITKDRELPQSDVYPLSALMEFEEAGT